MIQINEIWKPILNYENHYEVSNFGKVRNIKTKKLLSPFKNNSGHLKVNFCVNGCKSKDYIHRLVAVHFHPNLYGHAIVNHIDGNKENNHWLNLEWCTQSDNIKHAWDNGLFKKRGGNLGK